MPCTSVQTPQMRWAKAQASRGSRPRRMISMPRTMVPEYRPGDAAVASVCDLDAQVPLDAGDGVNDDAA